ncbi:Asp23/Gls24 family envelope stress response protein [Jatrophihabitans sp. YIM 134969]
MTTAVAAVPDRSATLADPDDRGRTTIADRVVEKIAAQAAVEVDHAAGLRRSLAGRSLGSPRVRATAEVDGRVAALRLDLAVDYPAPVRQVTRAVRQRVTEQVATLAGMRVDHVDITVAALRRPPVERRRVL